MTVGQILAKKRDGEQLSGGGYRFFIRGLVVGEIPDYQAAAWLMAVFIRGRAADRPPAWQVTHGQRCQSGLPGAPRRPSIAGDLQRQGHRAIHFAKTLGAKPFGWEYPDGDSYATLQLPGALHVNSVQTYEAAGVAGLGLITATVGDRPLLREWSVDRDLPDFHHRPLPMSPATGASAQPVAPRPRIHEMDRECVTS